MEVYLKLTIGNATYTILRKKEYDDKDVYNTYQLQRDSFIICNASHHNQLLSIIMNDIHVNLHNNNSYYHDNTHFYGRDK